VDDFGKFLERWLSSWPVWFCFISAVPYYSEWIVRTDLLPPVRDVGSLEVRSSTEQSQNLQMATQKCRMLSSQSGQSRSHILGHRQGAGPGTKGAVRSRPEIRGGFRGRGQPCQLFVDLRVDLDRINASCLVWLPRPRRLQSKVPFV
jgi:hypothetical protein